MKLLILTLILSAGNTALAYAHDGIYKIKAEPYANHCEARADKANVSRPNEQKLINNCLHRILINAARKIVNEYPEYAEALRQEDHMTERGLAVARKELAGAFKMLEDDIFTDPNTGEESAGSKAQKRLVIELGRKLDQLKIMENQPSLMNDED